MITARNISFRLISTGGLLAALSVAILAQPDTVFTAQMPEVVIFEKRGGIPGKEVPSNVISIGKDQIRNDPGGSLSDILHQVAGIDIRSRGPSGIQSDPGIRGSGFDQVVVLVNGIRISDPQTGHHSLNLPFDLSGIERIEVYKGPSARVFGQNAFAGAINIITKIPEKKRAGFSLQAGDFGLFRGNLNTTYQASTLSGMLSCSHHRSSGYRYNTDYRLSDVFNQIRLPAKEGNFHLSGGLSVRDFGANGFYASPENKDQYEAIQTSLVSLGYKTSREKKTGVDHQIYWRRNLDEYLFLRHDPSFYRNLHINHTAGIDLNFTFNSRWGRTGLGVDLNRVWIRSNRLGNHTRQAATVFLEHRFKWIGQRLQVAPGIQVNAFDGFENNLLPGLDAGFMIAPGWMTFFNSGYTYRIPTFTDLYYQDPANESNPALQPEYAFSGEIGIKNTGTAFPVRFQLSLFRRDERNLIDRIKETETDRWTPVNLRKMQVTGIDLNLELYNKPVADRSLIRRLDMGYTYNHLKTRGELPAFSRYAFQYLRHHLTAGSELSYGNRLIHTVRIRYADRINLDDYTVVDTRLTLVSKRISFFADVTNLFNTVYSETNLVELPGRWASLGIELNFEKK